MDFLFGLLAIGLGLAFCFLGLRLFIILLPVWGFLTGFSLGLVGTTTLLGTTLFADAVGIVVGVVLGLVFAVASYLIYGIGVLILGAGFGAGIGTSIMYALGFESAELLVFVVLAIAGIVVQYQWTRNMEMQAREMWKVETGM